MKMTTPIPDSIATPERIDSRIGQLNFIDGFPDDATAEKLYDNLDFMRGADAFLNAMVHRLKPCGSDWPARAQTTIILLFENLMDPHSLFLTGNTESIYNLMWLDTKAGPLVIETPPNILGIIDNHWFQYVGDAGNAGPDKGKGGSSCFCRRVTTERYPTATSYFGRQPTATCSSGAAFSRMAAPRLLSKTPGSSPKLLEGGWNLVILFHLFGGRVLRFSELERAIPAVPQRMLVQQLRQMERDGVVRLIVHHQISPKVEYCLTDWGQALCPALDSLLRWTALREDMAAPEPKRPSTGSDIPT